MKLILSSKLLKQVTQYYCSAFCREVDRGENMQSGFLGWLFHEDSLFHISCTPILKDAEHLTVDLRPKLEANISAWCLKMGALKTVDNLERKKKY